MAGAGDKDNSIKIIAMKCNILIEDKTFKSGSIWFHGSGRTNYENKNHGSNKLHMPSEK